jgi:hypothetical protein
MPVVATISEAEALHEFFRSLKNRTMGQYRRLETSAAGTLIDDVREGGFLEILVGFFP